MNIKLNFEETGFVAGTLVHTKEGLRPIEQIKVGDYVLSKPEGGMGEVSYKRVMNTFEFEDKELYYVSYDGEARIGFLIVTGNHPFWVVNEGDYSFAPEGGATPVNAWVRADQLSYEGGMSLLLHDGSKVTVNFVRKILRMAIPNMGWIVDDSSEGNPMHGHVVNLNGDSPQYCRGQIAGASGLLPVDGNPYGDIYEIENYDWDDPLKRKVYNIEVADNHSYFAGNHPHFVGQSHIPLEERGAWAWVHNSSDKMS